MKSAFKYNPYNYSNKLYWVKSIHSKDTSVSKGKTINKKIYLLQIQIIFLFIRISEYYNIKYEFNSGWKYHSATLWLYIPVGGVEGQWINIRVTMYYTSLFHTIFLLSAHLTRKIISGEHLSSLGIYHPSVNFPHSNLLFLKLLNQTKPNFASSPWDEDTQICSNECDRSQGGASKGP